MRANKIKLSGIGLCSSFGGFNDACAANRAGLDRFSGHPHFKIMNSGDEEPQPLCIAPAATNLFGYENEARLIKMFSLAWQDLLGNIDPCRTGNPMVFLALPDPEERGRDMQVAWDAPRAECLQSWLDRFMQRLFDQIDPKLHSAPVQAVFGDRHAFPRILEKARESIVNGASQACLLMVADSLLRDSYLQIQLENRQIKASNNPVGYIPGEGAAIILLTSEVTGNPKEISLGMEVGNSECDENEDQWSSENLFRLLISLADSGYEKTWFPQIVSDINGIERRAMELGMLQVKLKHHYPKARFLDTQIPALGFGEVGTMMGALAFATAIASVRSGYALHRQFFIGLSEESGKRSIIKLRV